MKENESTTFNNVGEKEKTTNRKSIIGKVVTIGGIAAVLLGVTAMAPLDDPSSNEENEEPESGNVDDNATINSTSASDGDSFESAFSKARKEVGPGGAFTWRGKVYSTYLKEEWEKLPPEQQAEFAKHAIEDTDLTKPHKVAMPDEDTKADDYDDNDDSEEDHDGEDTDDTNDDTDGTDDVDNDVDDSDDTDDMDDTNDTDDIEDANDTDNSDDLNDVDSEREDESENIENKDDNKGEEETGTFDFDDDDLEPVRVLGENELNSNINDYAAAVINVPSDDIAGDSEDGEIEELHDITETSDTPTDSMEEEALSEVNTPDDSILIDEDGDNAQAESDTLDKSEVDQMTADSNLDIDLPDYMSDADL